MPINKQMTWPSTMLVYVLFCGAGVIAVLLFAIAIKWLWVAFLSVGT